MASGNRLIATARPPVTNSATAPLIPARKCRPTRMRKARRSNSAGLGAAWQHAAEHAVALDRRVIERARDMQSDHREQYPGQ